MEPCSPLDYPCASQPPSPERYKDQLAGTVEPYDRHIFICQENHQSWPPNVENNPMPKSLIKAWEARKNHVDINTKIMVCDIPKGMEDVAWDGDVLLFPEMRISKFLDVSNMDKFVDNVLVKGNFLKQIGAWLSHDDAFIFVCAHGSRDKRCAFGSSLIEMFKLEIERRGWENRVYVSGCSDCSLEDDGHKFAGHLIIFNNNPEGYICGHWYGCVTCDDVEALLDQHIGQGEIVKELWRGQMKPKKVRWLQVIEEICKKVVNEEASEKQWTKCWHTIGIIGAVAAVAMACRFYRRWSR